MNFLDVTNENSLQELTKHLLNGVNVFVLIYMNGCGPCNETKPKWQKLKDKKCNNAIISQIDKDILTHKTEKDKFHLKDVNGFPTIRHYSKDGKKEYSGERDEDSFEKWINNSLKDSDKTDKTDKTKIDKTKPNSIYKKHFLKFSKKSRRVKGGKGTRRRKNRNKRLNKNRL